MALKTGQEYTFEKKDGYAVGALWGTPFKAVPLAVTEHYVVLRHIGQEFAPNHECAHPLALLRFKTAEQVADEERRAGIELLEEFAASLANRTPAQMHRTFWAAMYDAGVRKP